MTEIKINTEGAGQVKIADEVIAIIAGTAALEIDGVAGMAGNLTGDIAQMLGRRNLGRGVNIEVSDGHVKVTISILSKFGYKLQEISEAVQKRVKSAIENMIGLDAQEINIIIAGVLYYNNEENKSYFRNPLSKKSNPGSYAQQKLKPNYNEP